jgi:hypothetical protein
MERIGRCALSEFLEEYSGRRQTREKVAHRGLIAIAAVAIIWSIDWALTVSGRFNLRDVREQWQARRFFSVLS